MREDRGEPAGAAFLAQSCQRGRHFEQIFRLRPVLPDMHPAEPLDEAARGVVLGKDMRAERLQPPARS